MMDGLTDVDKAMFLDGLIVSGKTFNYQSDFIRIPLSFCRYFNNDEPILDNYDPDNGLPSTISPPDLYILNKFGFQAIQAKIEEAIETLSDKDIRLLSNTVECNYCHNLFNGPNQTFHRHTIQVKCPETNDNGAERHKNQLKSYLWRHFYSRIFIDDEDIELLIDGLNERETTMFLDGLIVGGKTFNFTNEIIQLSLSSCLYH
uniref:Uncharacterized protein n=1 Tax=Panagrolaimus sp. ES5 TaxID=591445 RepID=A0AC34G7L8_9BILA